MAQAAKAIEVCKTENGFHASTHLYPELWVRDLVYSEEVLIRLGYASTVRAHLENFMKKQRPNGQVPNVITTRARGVFNQAFHFWTSDNDILFVIGIHNYALLADDHEFLKAHRKEIGLSLSFVKERTIPLGFAVGLDWRDAMQNYHGKVLLTNQLLLFHLYRILGRHEDAESIRRRIVRAFYSEDSGFFVDFVSTGGKRPEGPQRFDSLGNALAILMDINPKASPGIAQRFERARTKFGYVNLTPPYRIGRIRPILSIEGMNAFVRNGAIFRNRPFNYQNSAVWPFVEARIIRGLTKAGKTAEAEKLARTVVARAGLNEWYSPVDGEPRGSRGQLWTAAAVIQSMQVSGEMGRSPVGEGPTTLP